MTTPIPFILTRDINGYNGFGRRPPTLIWNATLIANTATNFTLPSSYQNWIVLFSVEPGSNVWICINDTAAVPAGNTLVAATSELIPSAYQLVAGDIVSVISPDVTTNFSAAAYYLMNNH